MATTALLYRPARVSSDHSILRHVLWRPVRGSRVNPGLGGMSFTPACEVSPKPRPRRILSGWAPTGRTGRR